MQALVFAAGFCIIVPTVEGAVYEILQALFEVSVLKPQRQIISLAFFLVSEFIRGLTVFLVKLPWDFKSPELGFFRGIRIPHETVTSGHVHRVEFELVNCQAKLF